MPRKSRNIKSKPRRKAIRRSMSRLTSNKVEQVNINQKIDSLKELPELINMIGDPKQLFQKITKLQTIPEEDLKQALSILDKRITKATTNEERVILNKERIEIITALIA